MTVSQKKRGRPAGMLCSFTCCKCGQAESVRGGGAKFVCSACKPKQPLFFYRSNGRKEAGSAVALAIREGRLVRPATLSCVDCGVSAEQYDHRDYGQPLNVEAVCRRCNLLRGPGIPTAGYFTRSIDHGFVPYARKKSAEKLFARIGLDASLLAGLPPMLTVDNWRDLLPVLSEAISA